MIEKSQTTIRKIELVQTCEACPEQYDAIIDGETVGYLRLRHGVFRVECPDVGGEEVYSCSAYDIGDGIFSSEEVRTRELTKAKHAINNWVCRKWLLEGKGLKSIAEARATVKWNAQADQFNQWTALSSDEKEPLITAELRAVGKGKT